MADSASKNPTEVLKSYRAGDSVLYFVGMFDTGVTVFSQQIRALNLAWALVESKLIRCLETPSPAAPNGTKRIAVIGGGFAGLTFAAGLLEKRADVEITLFEQCDTLLPLQQGSDSRWLHPHIYDWPSQGSQSNAAMLPVLNWTAARASDVVVQVLGAWRNIVCEASRNKLPQPKLYCNTRHIHVHSASAGSALRIEWVGERREPKDGTSLKSSRRVAEGRSEDFDAVVVAIGFGPERDHAVSYWRNETFAQPSLEPARLTYLVSGQGDGAMIDLLRLRISQFRQDRILSELFNGAPTLLKAFKELSKYYRSDSAKSGMFDALEQLEKTSSSEFDQVLERLVARLRRDTDVVLRLKVKTVADLFEPENGRKSFQNKLLVYLLYKCGGFHPSHEDPNKLERQHGIAHDRVICRHGPQPKEYIRTVLSDPLYKLVVPDLPDVPQRQSDEAYWLGGYFSFPGPRETVKELDDKLRAFRREYLPGPVELLGTAFCSSLAGMFADLHTGVQRLRVTMHRVAVFGTDEVLQQVCDYVGTANANGTDPTAARTFPARNATIGLAYRCQRIIRSLPNVKPEILNRVMEQLNLNDASRRMSNTVGFVLAVPVLDAVPGGLHRVIAVVYIDSDAPTFHVRNEELKTITSMTTALFRNLTKQRAIERITNMQFSGLLETVAPESMPAEASSALELVSVISPPVLDDESFYLNFDYSDFIPV